jgi:DNA polymerase-4
MGSGHSAKMNALGIFTGMDIRNQPIEFMNAHVGKAGAWISGGIDERPVRIRKSVGAENMFASDLSGFVAMMTELELLIDQVWRHCESTGNRRRTVTLKVKFNDFEIITIK